MYEVKVRQAGNWTNSTSQELVGEEDVSKVIATAFPRTSLKLEDMFPSRWISILRDGCEVGGFNVAVDRTLFGNWKTGKLVYPHSPHVVGKWSCVRLDLVGVREGS